MKLDSSLRLRHIHCFLEAARAESLADAAVKLNISQPGVSKTLKELEQLLGVPLFDRSARKIRLNSAGRAFQAYAANAVADLMRAQKAVRGMAGTSEKLSVGILPTAATDLFPRAALAFANTHPHCTIHVITGPNWLLLSQLRDTQLDIVVGRMALPDQMTGLTFEQLYPEDVVLVARAGHPIHTAPDPSVCIADYPLILPPKGAVISQTVRGYLVSIGMHEVQPMFETVSLAFGRRAVQLSDALWFISRGVVADELANGALTVIPLDAPMLLGPVGISLRADAAPMLERQELVTILRQTARDLVTDVPAKQSQTKENQ